MANVEVDRLSELGRFDIVFCYGLLYHVENPIAALRNRAGCCAELLLLETAVTDYPRPVFQLAYEPPAAKNQAVSGFGCRPSPAGDRAGMLRPPPDRIWLDVGVHNGEKTLAAARQNPALRVYAFEPNLAAASRLMGVLANDVVLPVAVAEQNGSAPFHLNRYEGASSLLPFVPEGLARWIGGGDLAVTATVTVPTMRLDTFLDGAGIRRVDYLQIDAQGADLAVIRSAGERLKDIGRISLEAQTTPFELYRGASHKDDVMRFLTAAGFRLVETEAQRFDQEEILAFVRTARHET